MAISPSTFFEAIGPFGTRNNHYMRDLATFYIALGAAGLVAVRRPSWRGPGLALAAGEFALHAVNHLVDIGESHPAWNGPGAFAAGAARTRPLARVWRGGARGAGPGGASGRGG